MSDRDSMCPAKPMLLTTSLHKKFADFCSTFKKYMKLGCICSMS